MAARPVIVPIPELSDGVLNHRPDSTKYSCVNPPIIYLRKLATLWMTARGEAVPGTTYQLDKLPLGYAVYSKPRLTMPLRADQWLYGHPGHKTFDSPNRFFPHFLHIMSNAGSNRGCPCDVCRPRSRSKLVGGGEVQWAREPIPKSPPPVIQGETSKYKPKGRARLVDSAANTDDEGTPDIYRNLIKKLKAEGKVNQPIEERLSLDWRAERDLLPSTLGKLIQQPSWFPRPAEMVLYVRSLASDEELRFEELSGKLILYNKKDRKYNGSPTWEAGVIGQVASEALSIDELVREKDRESNVNYSGFRVEPFPDPNSPDKHWSKQYKYLPLRNIRPFALWPEYLGGIDESLWHPTIKHALTVMSSFSLVEKYRFSGTWPSASIFCKGIYIGSELILVGDTVCLLPQSPSNFVTDFLYITSIKLNFSNLDAASRDDGGEHRSCTSTVHVTGQAFTLDAARGISMGGGKSVPVSAADPDIPKFMDSFSHMYRAHDSDKQLRVPFHRIQGRVFEPEAMLVWCPSLSPLYAQHPQQLSLLDPGPHGVLFSREYSRTHDNRILSSVGKSWFWGDNRVETLALETLNGVEVGKADKGRKLSSWRKLVKSTELKKNAALRGRGRGGSVTGRWLSKGTAVRGESSSSATGTWIGSESESVDLSENDEMLSIIQERFRFKQGSLNEASKQIPVLPSGLKPINRQTLPIAHPSPSDPKPDTSDNEDISLNRGVEIFELPIDNGVANSDDIEIATEYSNKQKVAGMLGEETINQVKAKPSVGDGSIEMNKINDEDGEVDLTMVEGLPKKRQKFEAVMS